MGFGFGRRSRLRYVRLALLLLVVASAFVFRSDGKTYRDIHDVYLVVIIALIAAGLMMRGGFRNRSAGGPPGAMGVGRRGAMGPGTTDPFQQPSSFGGYGDPYSAQSRWSPGAPRSAPQANQGPPAAAGWYAEAGNPEYQRWWDGTAWGRRRHLQEGSWVEEPEGW